MVYESHIVPYHCNLTLASLQWGAGARRNVRQMSMSVTEFILFVGVNDTGKYNKTWSLSKIFNSKEKKLQKKVTIYRSWNTVCMNHICVGQPVNRMKHLAPIPAYHHARSLYQYELQSWQTRLQYHQYSNEDTTVSPHFDIVWRLVRLQDPTNYPGRSTLSRRGTHIWKVIPWYSRLGIDLSRQFSWKIEWKNN